MTRTWSTLSICGIRLRYSEPINQVFALVNVLVKRLLAESSSRKIGMRIDGRVLLCSTPWELLIRIWVLKDSVTTFFHCIYRSEQLFECHCISPIYCSMYERQKHTHQRKELQRWKKIEFNNTNDQWKKMFS